jgi:hypothetical protein
VLRKSCCRPIWPGLVRFIFCSPVTVVLVGVIAGVIAIPERVRSQAVIPDQVLCARCRIHLQRLVIIGSADGPGSLAGKPRSVILDGAGRYWVFVPGSLPAVFDSQGRFLETIGRQGMGPGEFRNASHAALLPGDSVLVLDWSQHRATVVGPDLRPGRVIQLPSAMLRWSMVATTWPDRVVANAILTAPNVVGWPLHYMSMRSDRATHLKSFGNNGGEMRPADPYHLGENLAPSSRGGFWAAQQAIYRVTRWDSSGRSLHSFERRPPWFSGKSNLRPGSHDIPPSPTGTALTEDAAGRLWVFTTVAARNWRAAWKDVPRAKTKDVRESSTAIGPDFTQLYQTMVEVIDPQRQRVIQRSSVGRWVVLQTLKDNKVVGYSEDTDGRPFLVVYKVVLDQVGS